MEEHVEHRASPWKLRVKSACITASLSSRKSFVSTQIYCAAQELLTATVLSVGPLC